MNPEDRLREAGKRVRSKLDEVEVPTPPRPQRTSARAIAFGMGMAAVIAVLGVTGLIIRLAGPDNGRVAGNPPTTSTTTTISVDDGDQLYRGTVTVIDTGENPVVCSGGVAESYPPQCGGPTLQGLDWSDIPWAETANGVTWADMTIEVRYDGSAFHLAAPAEMPEQIGNGNDFDFTPPCEPPSGGWVWTDGPMTSPEDMDNAIAYANRQPDRSAVWVYNLLEDPEQGDLTGRQEYVVVALFTENVAEHEAEMRGLWGGPLCVAEGATRADQLLMIQEEITNRANSGDIPGVVGFGYSYTDEVKGQVVLGALIVTSETHDWVEQNYSETTVRFESQFQAIEAP